MLKDIICITRIPIFLLGFVLLLLGVFDPFPFAPPINFNVVLILGILMFLSFFLRGLSIGISLHKIYYKRIEIVMIISFLFLLFIPSITGVLNGWRIENIFRDIIILSSFYLPLIFYVGKPSKERFIGLGSYLSWFIVMTGLVLVIRMIYILVASENPMGMLIFSSTLNPAIIPIDEWDTFGALSHDGSVLFAGIFLLVSGLQRLAIPGIISKFKVTVLLLLSVATIAMPVLILTRLFIVIYLATLVLSIFWLVRKSGRLVMMIILLCMACFFCLYFINLISLGDFFDLLVEKQNKVGLNKRHLEWASVFEAINLSGFKIFLGLGWGGIYQNPVLDGSYANFTHSIVSFFLLKTGFLGILLVSNYVFFIMRKLFRLTRLAWKTGENLPMVFGTWGVCIAGLFHTTFMAFVYGIVLLMISYTNRADNTQGDT